MFGSLGFSLKSQHLGLLSIKHERLTFECLLGGYFIFELDVAVASALGLGIS